MQHKEHILPPVDFRQSRAVAAPKQNGVPEKSDVILSQHSLGHLQRGLVAKNLLEIPQRTGVQVPGKNGSETQYFKLQKLSSQQVAGPVRITTAFSFAKLFPYILPQLNKDRALQLQTLYEKLQKNEIARDQFLPIMRGIVGSEMLKLAAEKLNAAQSRVQGLENQVRTPTVKYQTGPGMEMPRDPQTMKLLHQNGNADDAPTGLSSSESVRPFKAKDAPTTRDNGCPMGNQLSYQVNSSPASTNGCALLEEPYVGQKKQLENPDPLLQPLSKKQRTSEPCEDQSIEQLNDVTAVSGVNLREEEEQLLSGPKEDSRVSEASLRAMQEEEKLILEKVPLQRKLAEIMAKCGMKNVSKDVERCLSLGVEERIRGLLCNLIRLSKQRIDIEKNNHKTIITSDIHQHLMVLNRRAKEELEKKEAEAERLRKLSEPKNTDGPDDKNEKDEGRGKSRKVNKQEEDKTRATAANFAARAAVGGDDHLSKWQLMAEQAQQRREGSQVGTKPSSMFGRMTMDSQGSGRGQTSPLIASGAGRKLGRNQITAPQQGVSRSISMKDMISVLERETQMSKSTLIYNLYNKIRSDSGRDT